MQTGVVVHIFSPWAAVAFGCAHDRLVDRQPSRRHNVGSYADRRCVMLAVPERFATYDDYLAWADARPDEERYEIVEGYPVMSPGPGFAHQLSQSALFGILRAACPSGHVVLAAPFDWVLWELPSMQMREPDLLVMKRPDDIHIRRIARPPLLAVEILSPSTVEVDLFTKRREYARAGLNHYWVADPETPRVIAYRRDGDDMVIAADATGDERLVVTHPFPVDIAPDELLG